MGRSAAHVQLIKVDAFAYWPRVMITAGSTCMMTMTPLVVSL